MMRQVIALVAAFIVASVWAGSGETTIKKNYSSMDPSYCFAYQRVNSSGTITCRGYQYDCSEDTNEIGSDVDLSAHCASVSALNSFANSDFPSRYAAYKAAQGK